jgi:hypothetical protein
MPATAEAPLALIDILNSALVNHLHEGESVVLAGVAAIPASGMAKLIGSSYLATHTYLVAVTNQRLLLTRTSSWTGKLTPENIRITREIEYESLRNVTVKGSQLILSMDAEQVKLVGVKALWGVVQTEADFLVKLAIYLKAQCSTGPASKPEPMQPA